MNWTSLSELFKRPPSPTKPSTQLSLVSEKLSPPQPQPEPKMNKAQIMAELQTDEGRGPPGKAFQLYPDSRGYQSIGYGFLVDPRLGARIPEPVANFWLSYLVDQKMAELSTRKEWPWFAGLSPARQQLLVLLDYNEGLGSLLGFPKMLGYLAADNWDGAAMELKNSAWYGQVGHIRGDKYVNIMKTGVWQ